MFLLNTKFCKAFNSSSQLYLTMLICVSNYAMFCPWIWCVGTKHGTLSNQTEAQDWKQSSISAGYSQYLAGRNIYKCKYLFTRYTYKVIFWWNRPLKCPPVFPFPLGGTVAKTEHPRSVVLKLPQPSLRIDNIWDYKATEWPELYKVCTASYSMSLMSLQSESCTARTHMMFVLSSWLVYPNT